MASLRQLRNGDESARNGFDDVQSWINMAGATFPVQTTGLAGEAPLPGSSFGEFSQIYKTNGVVSACMAIRQRIFSEVTFRFVQINNGKTGQMFGTPDLGILERPWPNGTTGELAARMIQDVDLAGNFYAVREGNRLYRRDPSKTSIILSGDPKTDEFVDVLGYAYQPDGPKGPLYTYLPHEVCHWSPEPDPEHPYKGMSWITPILREIRSDNAATDHKAKFYANSATPNMVVTFPQDVMTQDQFDKFKAKMEAEYAGARGAGKTMYLAPGADVEVVGKDFAQMDFSNTQGRDETRIASRAGVPAVIVGLKESLAGSSLNQGNYAAARRSFADGTMRPLYRSAAAALETLVPAPQGKGASKLWYDDAHVAFFREDRADAATIQQTQATTIKTLVDAGFEWASVIAALEAEDRTLLKHTGMYSVQLHPPGTTPPATGANK
jgi:HK97 family phage portal protein